jgi:hypothetical protein
MGTTLRAERSSYEVLRRIIAARGTLHGIQVRNPGFIFGNRESRKSLSRLILCFLQVIAQLVTGNFHPPECV